MRRPLAAVTMAYNDPDYVEIWSRHYGNQVGPEHCYLIDHGSDDGSTDMLGAINVIRIPRSPHDDVRRSRFLSQFCSGLLEWYEAVLHTDIDEIVVADPARHAGLADYAATAGPDVVTAIGLNVLHLPAEEPAIDLDAKLLAQRRFAAFTSAMCKPVLIRRPVAWAPGFHCADAPIEFDSLYLFHLRFYDQEAALGRLKKTRTMPRADISAGNHQRISDDTARSWFANFGRAERCLNVMLNAAEEPLAPWLRAVQDSRAGREADTFTLDLSLNAAEIWEIPKRFRNVF
jgi:hypothetical protein